MNTTRRPRPRRGAVAALFAVLLVVLLAMVAFAVDLGYLMVAKTDLQRAADSAAHAAVLDLRSDDYPVWNIVNARNTAQEYVEDNKIVNSSATVSRNFFNDDSDGDVVVGRIDFGFPRDDMTFGNANTYNAVRVKIRQTADRNGEIPMFFAGIFGYDSMPLEAEATAAVMKNIAGFKIPATGENVPFLPITIDEDYWQAGVNGNEDDWSYNSFNGSTSSGADGIPEIVLFPSNPNSAGNFGTINVGTSAESTNHLAGQIRNGLSQSDLDHHGGQLALDNSGRLNLSGNPGLSASLKDDLKAIAGKPVIIPIYRSVSENGSKANFEIVKFVAVRIVAVNLTGGNKHVSIQPAKLTFKGVVQASQGSYGTSVDIYSPPMLVQ